MFEKWLLIEGSKEYLADLAERLDSVFDESSIEISRSDVDSI